MSDLWERFERCREEVAALRGNMPGRRWDALLAELAALGAEGRREALDQDALLREVTLVLSCTRAGRVLELIMDSVIRLSGAERGFVLLRGEDGNQEIAAARNMGRTAVETPAAEVSRRIVAQVLESGAPVRIDDALNTPPYSLAESVTRLRIVSVVCVPIEENGRILGTIYLENRTLAGVFSGESERLVAGFARKIGGAILNAEAFEGLRRSRDRLQQEFARESGFEGVVGRAPAFAEALRIVAVAAESDLPILIEGESGTGKELVARAAHLGSPRKEGPFVSINCAALPAALLESELFGHRRGAFTGATCRRAGLFATANGGTLFLDEIGEMPLELQAKLLRVLQSGEFRSLGSDSVTHTNVRVLSATARDLGRDAREGRFREDLFFRLNGVRVVLPPLRDRREDIPLLVEHFLERCAPAGDALRWDADAFACLLAYDYPGNVRQLETIVRRAALFAREGVVGVDALPPEVVGLGQGVLRLPARVPTTAAELLSARQAAKAAAAREVERAFLLRALAAGGGRPGEAARQAQMNRSQFARMLTKHGLSAARSRKSEQA